MKHEMLVKRLFPCLVSGYMLLWPLIFLSFILTSLLMMPDSVYAGSKHHGSRHHHDNKGMNKMHWMAPELAALRPNPVKHTVESVKMGEALFIKNCAVCHGKEATGNGPAAQWMKPRPANLRKMSGMHPDGDFEWKIANGRGGMPSWNGILTDNERWYLVNYIQSLSASPETSEVEHADHDHADIVGHKEEKTVSDKNSVQ